MLRSWRPDINDILQIECRGLIMTTKARGPFDFISRFFAPRVGVFKDPVTGSAHCKLADYWHRKLNQTEFIAYQASKRGGILNLKIQDTRVLITGQARTILAGNWLAEF